MKTSSKRGVVIALGTLSSQLKFYDKALPPSQKKVQALAFLEGAHRRISEIEKEMPDDRRTA